jgi:putative SOS response-associated peptidase YedK
MCGRFTLTREDAQQLALELGVDAESLSDYKPRYNIAPTDPHWIVRMKYEERELLPARWGLVNSWAKDAKRAAKQINAKAETLTERAVFREAFAQRRCVVPADGFFEWTGPKAARQPVWFHREDGGLILFAGLYEYWRKEGEWERTFTIVTTEPNDLLAQVHDRMPVILPEGIVDGWLDPNEEDSGKLRGLLVPAADGVLIATRVSSRANSVKNDDPGVLEPVAAQAQMEGLT